MNDVDALPLQDPPVCNAPSFYSQLVAQLRPLLVGFIFLTLLTGVAFPVLLALIACPLFSHQANGSLVTRDDVVVGSELIGQGFSKPEYFHPRPSAAGNGYDPLASGGTNLGPSNPRLRDGALATPDAGAVAGVRELAAAYRLENGLRADILVPIDAVTRSGSGLDPHISPANADLQVARIAKARQRSEAEIGGLVAEFTVGRQLGFLGEPQVNLLLLNLALDRISQPIAPRSDR